MAKWTIRRLDKAHDRSVFHCGQPILNEWLKDRAGQFDRRDLSRTFVATRPNEALVLGYYAISTHRVIYDGLPSTEAKGLPLLGCCELDCCSGCSCNIYLSPHCTDSHKQHSTYQICSKIFRSALTLRPCLNFRLDEKLCSIY